MSRPGEQLRQLAAEATPGTLEAHQDYPDGHWWVSRLETDPADVAMFNADQEHDARLFAKAADLAVLVADLADALDLLSDCKGPWEGTVSSLGGYPAVCPDCDSKARALLARVRELEARIAAPRSGDRTEGGTG